MRAPGSALPLPKDELHVWRASLDLAPEAINGLAGLLATDERERARRFRFERDRSRYIAGRGLLRMLLGSYLAQPPAEVRFTLGRHRKPFLVGPGPWFNLSHSGPIALFAFSSSGEVGVDVELDDADFARERIAERFFSPGEVKTLRSLPEGLQARAFLTCWTRKEAFMKARGDGLTLALDSFDVTLAPGQPVRLERTAWSRGEPAEWSMIDLSDRERGFIAAIAIRTNARQVVKHRVAELIDNQLVTEGESR